MKKKELELKRSHLEVNLCQAETKIVLLEKMVYTGEGETIYGKETWQHRARRNLNEVKDLEKKLKNKDKKIESLEQAQINMRNNNLEKTDLLGEKIEALQDEIRHMKGLKRFAMFSTDRYEMHAVLAEDYHESGLYTVFTIKNKEIFKIKTDLITSMTKGEY